MSQTPPLAEVIEAGIDERLEKFVTALPAIVKHWNYLANTVDVEMATTNLTEDSLGRPRWFVARVNNVPLLYPGSGKDRMTFPIKEGSYVLYVVSSLPTNDFIAKGGQIGLNVPTVARNNVCFGYAIPGLYTSPEANVTNLPSDQDNVVISAEHKLKLGANTGTEPTIMADKFWDGTSTITPNGLYALLSAMIKVLEPVAGPLTAALDTLNVMGFKTTKVEVK